MGMSVCGYAHVSVGACGGQRCQTLCTEGTGDCKPHSVGAGNQTGSSTEATSAFSC